MRTVKNEQYNIYIGISIKWFEGVNPHSMDQSRKRVDRDTANSTTTRRQTPRHPPSTQPETDVDWLSTVGLSMLLSTFDSVR